MPVSTQFRRFIFIRVDKFDESIQQIYESTKTSLNWTINFRDLKVFKQRETSYSTRRMVRHQSIKVRTKDKRKEQLWVLRIYLKCSHTEGSMTEIYITRLSAAAFVSSRSNTSSKNCECFITFLSLVIQFIGFNCHWLRAGAFIFRDACFFFTNASFLCSMAKEFIWRKTKLIFPFDVYY